MEDAGGVVCFPCDGTADSGAGRGPLPDEKKAADRRWELTPEKAPYTDKQTRRAVPCGFVIDEIGLRSAEGEVHP